jgi:hypothetical protein
MNSPVCNITGKAHFVGHDNHRALFLCQLADSIQHLAHQLGSSRGWFIEQDHVRAHRQRAGNRHALLLPQTDGADSWSLYPPAHLSEQFARTRRASSLGSPFDNRPFNNVLQHRPVREQIEVLKEANMLTQTAD